MLDDIMVTIYVSLINNPDSAFTIDNVPTHLKQRVLDATKVI